MLLLRPHRRTCWAIAALALLALPDARGRSLPWEVWQSPAQIAALDASDSVVEVSSHCLDGCRYDRSNAGSETDNPFPLRWLYSAGDEAVILDERGAGALTRFWVTTGFGVSTCIDPATRVRFYVDESPAIELPLAALFDGSTPPFTAPLVAGHDDSSGGYVSRVPIAYAQSLRIALVGADNGGVNPCQPVGADPAERLLWFQLQLHRLRPGTAVTDFVAQPDSPGFRAFLGHRGDDPWNGMLAVDARQSTLLPGATLALASNVGAGWLRGVRLLLPVTSYSSVRLRIRIDGDLAVDMPLADFFGASADDALATASVLFGSDAQGWLYSWWPMRFARSAEVELVADSTMPQAVGVASAISVDAAVVNGDSGTFAATLVDDCVAGGSVDLYVDHGAGKLVALSARYRSNGTMPDPGYLEGDERVSVDGAIAPAWYGTGIEDFFDGGFYFDRGPFTRALTGATTVGVVGDAFVTPAYRLLPTDAIVYTNGVQVTQEAGSSAKDPRPVCVRRVAYAYRQDRASTVDYDGFELGNTAAAQAHGYVPPSAVECAQVQAMFEDTAATSRVANACRYAAGSSRFVFHLDAAARTPLRLRRTFDAGVGAPGTTAGSAAAAVRVDGVVVGRFPPAIANPARRWQQQEIVLDVDASAGDLAMEIVPEFAAFAPGFSESAWLLRGGWKDVIFADGLE